MNTLILLAILGQWSPCGPSGCGPSGCGPIFCPPAPQVQLFGKQQQIQQRSSGFNRLAGQDNNVVLVRGFEGGESGKMPLANGFVVANGEDGAIVLTVAHLVVGCVSYEIEYPGRGKATAGLLATDLQLDAALFYAKDLRSNKTTVGLSKNDPPIGSRIQFNAWKSECPNGQPRRYMVFSQGTVKDQRSEYVMYFVSNPLPEQGISGSPLLDISSSGGSRPVVGMVRGVSEERGDAEAVKGSYLFQFVQRTLTEYEANSEPETPPLPEPDGEQIEEEKPQSQNIDLTLILQKIEESKYDDSDLRILIENSKYDDTDLKNSVAEVKAELDKTKDRMTQIELAWENLKAEPKKDYVTREELNEIISNLYTITDVTQIDGTVLRQKRKLGQPTHIKLFPEEGSESK
jgi:hypothetical protein